MLVRDCVHRRSLEVDPGRRPRWRRPGGRIRRGVHRRWSSGRHRECLCVPQFHAVAGRGGVDHESVPPARRHGFSFSLRSCSSRQSRRCSARRARPWLAGSSRSLPADRAGRRRPRQAPAETGRRPAMARRRISDSRLYASQGGGRRGQAPAKELPRTSGEWRGQAPTKEPAGPLDRRIVPRPSTESQAATAMEPALTIVPPLQRGRPGRSCRRSSARAAGVPVPVPAVQAAAEGASCRFPCRGTRHRLRQQTDCGARSGARPVGSSPTGQRARRLVRGRAAHRLRGPAAQQPGPLVGRARRTRPTTASGP